MKDVSAGRLALLLTRVAERRTGATWRRIATELGRVHAVALTGSAGAACGTRVGPAAFIGCTFTETTLERCTLDHAAFDGCKLTGVAIGATDLRGAVLRGNDLSGITGVAFLRGAIISDDQLAGLTEAVVRDLELDVTARS